MSTDQQHRRVLRVAPSVAALVAACLAVVAPAARAEAACAPALAQTAIAPDVPILDWSENVGYDARGDLWVARIYRNEVQRYDRTGALTASVPVEFPGAVRLGPDGLMYVVYGDTPVSAVRPGGVVRFDPAAPAPAPEVFVAGLASMPNGAAFGDDGALYVAAGNAGVIRVRPDGTVDPEWSARAAVPGANGIAIRDGVVYLTANSAPLGRVLSFPVDAPERRTVLADLTSRVPGAPDFADDLIIDSAGYLYVTTLSGTLVRVDSRGGAVCTLLTGEPMTSVVAVPQRPGELLAGTEGGAVLRIRLSA
ncbi:SMP-30/gluconolactonase/LRE family protein [Nocardia arizonensis]|uniref:SMP-30/gluconolactonase/LRE family protein n=1 Tax=Nocardia arizonensis TaxID=1141647 RepID=UPI0006D10B0A|nr:hypothetical protein [Nocardia arizonensis]